MTSDFDSFGVQTPPADLEAIGELIGRFDSPRVIEVGSWVGRTAIALYNFGAKEVHCIDTWRGARTDTTIKITAEMGGPIRLFSAFCENVGKDRLYSKIYPHIGESLFYATFWPWKADLIFIDASHDYRSIANDIRAWTPNVRDGGIICGHDYDNDFGDVKKAVKETGGGKTFVGTTIWWRNVYVNTSESSP